MKKNIYYLLLILVFSLIQCSGQISIFKITPDILLILTVYIAINNGSMKGQIFGFVSGLIEDIFSGNIPGFYSFAKTLIGFLAGRFYQKIIFYHFFLPLFLVLGLIILKGFIYFILGLLFISQEKAFSYLKYRLIFEAVYTSILSPFIFYVFNKFGLSNIQKG